MKNVQQAEPELARVLAFAAPRLPLPDEVANPGAAHPCGCAPLPGLGLPFAGGCRAVENELVDAAAAAYTSARNEVFAATDAIGSRALTLHQMMVLLDLEQAELELREHRQQHFSQGR